MGKPEVYKFLNHKFSAFNLSIIIYQFFIVDSAMYDEAWTNLVNHTHNWGLTEHASGEIHGNDTDEENSAPSPCDTSMSSHIQDPE